jgi:hypothetical protein
MSVLLNGTGDAFGESAGVTLYQVPLGFEFALHRIILDVDGYTPAAPFTNVAGYAEIHQHSKRIEFVNFSPAAGGLPAVNSWGTQDAPRFLNGDRVRIEVHGGPANVAMAIRAQGTLFPLTLQ